MLLRFKKMFFFICRLITPGFLLGLYLIQRICVLSFYAFRQTCRFVLRTIRSGYAKLVRDNGFADLPEVIPNQGLNGGLAWLDNKNRYYRSYSVRFLMSLYKWLSGNQHHIPRIFQDDFVLHFCCWGEAYSQKAKNFLLPSLLAQSNLPYLSTQKRIIILVHGDEHAQSILFSDAKLIEKIKQYAEFTFILIPKKILKKYNRCNNIANSFLLGRFDPGVISSRYHLLGALQSEVMRTALKSGSTISFLMPDFLLSSDFLKQGYQKIQQGKIAVFVTAFRSNFNTLSQNPKTARDPDSCSISISGPELMKLQVEHMHDLARRRIVSESTVGFERSAQLIFTDSKDRFIIRAYHYHPVMVDCSGIEDRLTICPDYLAIDNTFFAKILKDKSQFEKQLWVCDRASDMAFAELTDARPAVKNLEPAFDKEALVNAVSHMISSCPTVYNAPLNRYFSGIRYKYFLETQEADVGVSWDERFISCVEEKINL